MVKSDRELLGMIENEQQLNFDEFIRVFQLYGELEFVYSETKYAVIRNKKYYMFEHENSAKSQEYESLDEFKEKANIDGLLLKEIWKDIIDLSFLT